MKTDTKMFKGIIITSLFLGLTLSIVGQKPKKYLKNGYTEQAFVEAAHRQNKKVKLKKKHTEVIYASYEVIYKNHSDLITSPETNWEVSYSRFIRMTNFRARVKHPGVYDKLKNVLFDATLLDHLGGKFNAANANELKTAAELEKQGKFEKALLVYQGMAKRHEQAIAIAPLEKRISLIDYETKLEITNQNIGDQYILEAKKMLVGTTKKEALAAIDFIEKARTYRPLDFEEEELLELANLMIGESWITEAQKLLKTPTKKNARLAYELINRARSIRTLKVEEELLYQTAERVGMTRILVTAKNDKGIHDSQTLTGILNQKKSSTWIKYYYEENENETIDFELVIDENKPTVKLGDIRKEITQNTKSVEYWEEVTDANGNTTNVKKNRLAIAVISTVSRTKTAQVEWEILLKEYSSGNSVYSETKETRHEITNQYASLISGDILALPENIETEVDLDSQPFPSDKDMLTAVTQMYLDDLKYFTYNQKDHMRNINSIVGR